MDPVAGLSLDGKDAMSSVKDKVHFPSCMGSIEVKRRGFRLPAQPSKELIEDSRFKKGTIRKAYPLREQAGKPWICPVEFRALHQAGGYGRKQGAQEEHLVGDLKKTEVAFDRIYGHAKFPGELAVGEKLGRPGRQEVLGQGKLIQVSHPAQIRQVPLQVGPPEISKPDQALFLRQRPKAGIATPAEMLLSPTPPQPGDLSRKTFLGHPANPWLSLLPDAVQAGRGDFLTFDLLHQGQRPKLQQADPPCQSFPNLPKQEDLGGAEEEEAMTFPPVRQELDCIQECRLFLDFIQNHQ